MGRRNRILVVDDEAKIRELIRDLLVERYDVVLAATGEEALELAREKAPDLVILDMLMPRMDGLLACSFLRKSASTKHVPIIMLTALKDSPDRVNAFKAGADDFISKPFHPDELLTRIEAKLARFESLQKAQPRPEIVRGNLSMNLLDRQVIVGEEPIYLTVLEFGIVKCLLEADGAVRSRKELVESVWGDASVPVRVLDSHILTLRRKLKEFDHAIETVYGCGYVIRTRFAGVGAETVAERAADLVV